MSKKIYRELPEVVFLKCNVCGRAGRYRRERFLEIAGTENTVDALVKFAIAAGCERAAKMDYANYDRDTACGIGTDIQRELEMYGHIDGWVPEKNRPPSEDSGH